MKFLCLDLKWKTQKRAKQQPLGSPLYFVKNERGEERFSKQKTKWGAFTREDQGCFVVVVMGLVGEIPDGLGGLRNLKVSNISDNKLSGRIPASFGDMESLESLDLSQNNLSGEIPETFSQLLQLRSLDLSKNKITGNIPDGPQMDWLDPFSLSMNDFSGQFPDNIDEAPRLRTLELSDNNFSGTTPQSIHNLLHLEVLDIYHPTDFPATSFQILIKIHHWFMMIYPTIDIPVRFP
ncbi:hypothetical protein OIU85_003613 [Salix viminalis]|uniref:Leucine-rich repeat-containing N-terminal plant-type domain-containing protein n=1 Tax=Salix viminalis TaxID=40686 RepID=A0A9Q0PZT2_SALVM|nr:hypothetical protein OIU85_003613 [Salix viminalis]